MVEKSSKQHLRKFRSTFAFCILIAALAACTPAGTKATISPTPSIAVNQALFPSPTPEVPTLSIDTPTPEPTLQPVVTDQPAIADVLVLSLAENGYFHLFAYQPMQLPYTRLTDGDFDDRDPVISPDGTQIAFSSNREGHWDIYLLDLPTGKIVRVTSTSQYDGAPSWSPDGQWISYESYDGVNLNIMIQSVSDPTTPAIQLTQNSGNNYSPAWSPAGREVAFVTDRAGSCEIWTARLDTVDNRFNMVVGQVSVDYTSPAWSPDGSQLSWTRTQSGLSQIESASVQNSYQDVRTVADGVRSLWSPAGDALFILAETPNASYFSAVKIENQLLLYQSQKLPGAFHGVDWKNGSAAEKVLTAIPDPAAVYTASSAWKASITSATGPDQRYGLVELQNVAAPYAYLSDAVDDGFTALRAQTGKTLGWDFLAGLDDATLPLSSAPQPGIAENWLFTGRAIAVNSVPLQADWMTVSREDFNGKTYWRVWVKCLKQDGSCGEPQHSSSWDFTARYSSDLQAYEDGGKINGIPSGYWVDFTSLALQFNWERLPAGMNWRSYFPGTLFNQFVLRQGFTWDQAMLQVYPAEALPTSTSAAQP